MRDPVAHHLKTRIGGYVKNGNQEAAAKARRELELHNLAKSIKRVIDAEPPITEDQRAQLAALIDPAVAA